MSPRPTPGTERTPAASRNTSPPPAEFPADTVAPARPPSRPASRVATEPGMHHQTPQQRTKTTQSAERPEEAAASVKDAKKAALRKQVHELETER